MKTFALMADTFHITVPVRPFFLVLLLKKIGTAYWVTETQNNGVSLAPAVIGSYDGIEDRPSTQAEIDAWKTSEGIEGTYYGCGYLFYGGNAPCRPIITFEVTPKIKDDYIVIPYNPIHSLPEYLHKTCNTFIVEGEEKQIFKFTTPSVYTGYNQVIRIFKQFQAMTPQGSWEQVRAAIRDGVKHWAPRAYALMVLDGVKGNSTTVQTDATSLNTCIFRMKCFLDDNANLQVIPSSSYNFQIAPTIFQINCQTGEVLGTFAYRIVYGDSPVGVTQSSVENVGDMMRSNYLTIEERNYPDEQGLIQCWDEYNKENSHRYYTDCPMTHVLFQYQYMYY